MNYSRIYADFIADRRAKELNLKSSGSYAEKHHVVPRSLGGDDAPTNLITLTPEDHFFAHLLLAKMHGGTMWAPIAFMVGGSRKDYRPTQSRVAHGWAARAMAKAASGSSAHQFDHLQHRLVHTDGRIWSGLQSDMPAALGLSKSMANMVIKGRVSVAKGWSIEGARRKSLAGSGHHMYRSEVREFLHVDGRSFTGTQFDFSEAMGVSRPAASKIASGECAVWNGWHLRGAVLPTTGRGAKWLKLQKL